MGNKTEINVIVSPKMTSGREDDCIRLTLRTREHLALSAKSIRLGAGNARVELRVRQAFKEDIQLLAKRVAKGEISDAEALCTAFVSKKVGDRITLSGEETWVSDSIEKINIGCDPEFGLVYGDNLVRGDEVLPGTKSARFGEDGPGVEIRPAHSQSHIKVVENIADILRQPPAPAGNYRWVGGATYKDANRTYWFGGHVHFGRPAFINPDNATESFNYVARVLDHLVALPLLAFDKPDPHLRRNGCPHKYGKAGDIRLKGEGDQVRFEYRVLSGLWLTHPTLARIVLGISKAVAEAVYSQLKQEDPDGDLVATSAGKVRLGRAFGVNHIRQVTQIINQAEVKPLAPSFFSPWEKQMKELRSYDEYAREIEAAIELVRASPDGVAPQLSLDLKSNWKREARSLLPKANPKLKTALEAVEEGK
jgi:hypothetical protein